MTSKLIQALIVDRSEIGQDNTGLPIFTLTSDDITDIAETIVKQLSTNEDKVSVFCECGGNERVALDCTMKPCKRPNQNINKE